MQHTSLRPLFDAGRLWKGNATLALPVTATGIDALNASLTGGGWPAHMLIEWLTDQPESLPIECVLRTWRQHQDNRRLVLVNPPHRPCAEALMQQGLHPEQIDCIRSSAADSAWCLEQLAQSACIASVIAWSEAINQTTQLRRLQLACQQGQTQLFLIRDNAARRQASPAPIRAQLTKTTDHSTIEVFKQPGASGKAPVSIPQVLDWVRHISPAQRKITNHQIPLDVH